MEVKNVKAELPLSCLHAVGLCALVWLRVRVRVRLVKLYSRHRGKSPEQIEADIRRPKYFSPSEAIEYGMIDKVLYTERSCEDRGVVSELKKAQLI
ncbi:ATP-dependent Clp protease proteolytic subunit-protein 4, chloroplastic [Ancistrocladus abbreviatus]